MTGKTPTRDERAEIAWLRASLEEWALADIKRAASPEVDLPRVAFVGLAAWIDALTFVRYGRNRKARPAWASFFAEYLPEYADDPEHLRDGLRNALIHEYGTRDVALTHGDPDAHGMRVGDTRVINLDNLIAECESAFHRLLAHIEKDAAVRSQVLARSAGLLAPVTIGATSASVTTSEGLVRVASSAVFTSATGPLHISLGCTDPPSPCGPE